MKARMSHLLRQTRSPWYLIWSHTTGQSIKRTSSYLRKKSNKPTCFCNSPRTSGKRLNRSVGNLRFCETGTLCKWILTCLLQATLLSSFFSFNSFMNLFCSSVIMAYIVTALYPQAGKEIAEKQRKAREEAERKRLEQVMTKVKHLLLDHVELESLGTLWRMLLKPL